ncbi:hypothetical protein GGQ64_005246 [Rhizobium azooxidifex]|uniref:Uncharacterized protein n=1 Tax=Mycoplana azooxidifex TaxID=1636188 RepID=A0A7W6GNH7_9HYPH|nr:DUF6527 family protein [Mycoplana azooxidifex]MBB3979999.1 hypothetical protein [Mycoplana azooxidifex]
MTIMKWFRRIWGKFGPARRLVFVEDTLPEVMPFRDLVPTRDDGDDWSVGMRCPCGCGERIELMILRGTRPRWDISVNEAGKPSLHPSVWRNSGCRSHFWVREGRVIWCD